VTEEKKEEQVVEATEATAEAQAQQPVVDPNEREQRRGSRERGPRNEQRREREDKSSPFLPRL
jgi:small subunit ribosomal protein S5